MNAASGHELASANRMQRSALAASAAGWLLFALMALFRPAALWHGYLVAFNYWLGIPLGCLVIVWLHQLTGGGWGWVLRPAQAAAATTLPLLAVAFVPIVFGMTELYPWTRLEWMSEAKDAAAKSQYLNESFFIARAIVYFVVWIVLALLTARWIRAADLGGDARPAARLLTISGPAIIVYALTITFAGIDWIMSLDPRWYSTIFSVVYSLGQILAGLAFAVMAVCIGTPWIEAHRDSLTHSDEDPTRSQAHLEPATAATRKYLPDAGNLLLAFVMFWAYVSFSQYLLIWAGNLPEEICWYVSRTQTGWKWVAILLAACEFCLPFALLLSRSIKHDPRSLAKVAGLLLAIHFVELAWQILPEFSPNDDVTALVDGAAALFATIGIGGLWTAAWLRALTHMPIYPRTATNA